MHSDHDRDEMAPPGAFSGAGPLKPPPPFTAPRRVLRASERPAKTVYPSTEAHVICI